MDRSISGSKETAAAGAAAHGPGRAIARLARQVEHGLAPVGLSLQQYRALALLAEGPAGSTRLAERLTVSPPSVTAVIDGLVARELVATFYPDLKKLLAASDFVSLHIPGGKETANLIGAEALAAMKPGAYLINTARGGVVDHAALAEALRSGHLAGAGLDVFPAEPEVPEELPGLENVVLLPHLGSATRETRIAMGERALANVVAWAEGRALPDRVA